MNAKRPAILFYPGDWMKAPDIRMCSFAARGLWFDMLCLMHESDRRGFLQHPNGSPILPEQLCRMTGGSRDEVIGLLQELENLGVFSRTTASIIYNRRMVSDEEKRRILSRNGKLGRNPSLKQVDKQPLNQMLEDVNVIENVNEFDSGNGNGEAGKGKGITPEEIYLAYPRHIGRPKAVEAILKAAKRLVVSGNHSPAEFLLGRATAYAAARRTVCENDPSEDQFTPHPATWFNQGRYDDDPAEWSKVKVPPLTSAEIRSKKFDKELDEQLEKMK